MRKSILTLLPCFCFVLACQPEQPEIILKVSEAPSAEPSVPAAETRQVADVQIEVPPVESQPSSAIVLPSNPPLETSPTPTPNPQPVATLAPVVVVSATPLPTPVSTPFSSGGGSGGSGGGSGSSGGGSSSSSSSNTSSVQVNQALIANVPVLNLYTGQSLPLYGRVLYSSGESPSQKLTWSSSNEAVATISANGVVQALKSGQVDFIARSQEDPTKIATVTFQVLRHPVNFSGTISYKANEDIFVMKGNNSSPLRLTISGAAQEKNWPHLSWNGDLVAYRILTQDIVTLDTSGNGTPTVRDLPNVSVPAVPYYWYNGEILYQNVDDQNNNLMEINRFQPDGSIVGWINNLGFVSGPLGGVTPAGLIAYEQFGRIKTRRFDDVNSVVDYGGGADVSMAKTSHPTYITFSLNNEVMKQTLGGGQVNVTQRDGYDGQATPSPDETHIVFVSDRDGSRDIFIMKADGTEVQNLTNTPDINESQPDWSR